MNDPDGRGMLRRKAVTRALRSRPGQAGWQRLALRFARAGHGFWLDDCIDRASLLAYTTLLGIVPFAVVVFSLWNLVGFDDSLRIQLNELVLRSFMPSVGETVLRQIDRLAARGTQLGYFGVAGLAVTAILLIQAIERHLNAIWGVSPGSRWRRILRYLLILVFGPLGLAASLVLLGPIGAMLQWFGHLPKALTGLTALVAFSVEAGLLSLVYLSLPAARVTLRDAFLGGFAAALLLSSGKLLLGLYLRFSTFESLYGALAAFPIFLLWLFLAWCGVLFGAELAAAREGRAPAA